MVTSKLIGSFPLEVSPGDLHRPADFTYLAMVDNNPTTYLAAAWSSLLIWTERRRVITCTLMRTGDRDRSLWLTAPEWTSDGLRVPTGLRSLIRLLPLQKAALLQYFSPPTSHSANSCASHGKGTSAGPTLLQRLDYDPCNLQFTADVYTR